MMKARVLGILLGVCLVSTTSFANDFVFESRKPTAAASQELRKESVDSFVEKMVKRLRKGSLSVGEFKQYRLAKLKQKEEQIRKETIRIELKEKFQGAEFHRIREALSEIYENSNPGKYYSYTVHENSKGLRRIAVSEGFQQHVSYYYGNDAEIILSALLEKGVPMNARIVPPTAGYQLVDYSPKAPLTDEEILKGGHCEERAVKTRVGSRVAAL